MPEPDPSDVDYHLDRAQALLEFAGAPSSPSEALIQAQTSAIVALLLHLRSGSSSGIKEAKTGPLVAPFAITQHLSATSPDVAAAAMQRVAADPVWPSNKIYAIKTYRSCTRCGLAEAKNVIEASIEYARLSGHNWWEKS